MKTNKIFQTGYLDLLFENRNKLYGAYELRKNYSRRAGKALGTIILLGLLSSVIPLISGFTPDNSLDPPKQKPDSLVITFIDLPRRNELPPKVQNTIKTATTKGVIPTKIVKPIDLPVVPILPSTPISGIPGNQTSPGIVGTIPTIPGTGGTSSIATTITSNVVDDKIHEDYDVQYLPEFPGGDDALYEFLSSHLKYPSRASSNDVEGKVVLSFVVNKVGEIDEIKIERSLGYGCDEEAIRVVNSMPKWKPARNNGAPVKVLLNLPIIFELDRR